MPALCSKTPNLDHSGCPSSVECYHATVEIKYMMHRACGEVFEQVDNYPDVKDVHHRQCEALKADALAGKRWKMNMTEEEAF